VGALVESTARAFAGDGVGVEAAAGLAGVTDVAAGVDWYSS
jgi:hypothetical protein